MPTNRLAWSGLPDCQSCSSHVASDAARNRLRHSTQDREFTTFPRHSTCSNAALQVVWIRLANSSLVLGLVVLLRFCCVVFSGRFFSWATPRCPNAIRCGALVCWGQIYLTPHSPVGNSARTFGQWYFAVFGGVIVFPARRYYSSVSCLFLAAGRQWLPYTCCFFASRPIYMRGLGLQEDPYIP